MTVLSLSPKQKRVEVIREMPTFLVGTQAFRMDDLNPSLERFFQFWDYMDTIQVHGYTRAAMSVIGRSALGAWWSLRKHSEYEKGARDIQRKRLYAFYNMAENRSWTNIKDYQSFAYKLLIAVMYLKYFGQAAFQVVRNKFGDAIGLDFLPGLVIPNVKANGDFKNPAFVQYPTRDPTVRLEFKDPKDVVYIINPDFEGSVLGGSDMASLAKFTWPLDIYLQSAAANYMQNRDKPELIYQLPADISDDGFDEFVKQIETRYSGPSNIGRNPIVVQGELKVDEMQRLPESLPYQQSRQETRKEVLAVSGTAGAKLGLTEDMTNANLREMRREFHETTMLPLFRLVELALYEQVHVREFTITSWEFKFNSPDFLNAVERATVHMRYYQMGAVNPNEIRYDLGRAPRDDEQGDLYYDQLVVQQPLGNQGSPPDGRPVNPDDPAQVGEPSTNIPDPVRGDDHDEDTLALLTGVRDWRTYAIKRMKRGRSLRPYEHEAIPDGLRDIIQVYLEQASSVGDVVRVFDQVMDELSNSL